MTNYTNFSQEVLNTLSSQHRMTPATIAVASDGTKSVVLERDDVDDRYCQALLSVTPDGRITCHTGLYRERAIINNGSVTEPSLESAVANASRVFDALVAAHAEWLEQNKCAEEAPVSQYRVLLTLRSACGCVGQGVLGTGQALTWDREPDRETVQAIFCRINAATLATVETVQMDGEDWREFEECHAEAALVANVLNGHSLATALQSVPAGMTRPPARVETSNKGAQAPAIQQPAKHSRSAAA